MLDIKLSESANGVFHIRVAGVLKASDYRRELPLLENALADERAAAPRILLELHGFRGWTPSALLQELKFDLKYGLRFDRVAVVGGGPLVSIATLVTRPLLRCEIKLFSRENVEAARRWVFEGRGVEVTPGIANGQRDDLVEEASLESFPASDPPGYTPSHT